MDTVTHVLSATLWTEPLDSPRLAENRHYARWRDRMAVILGASVLDLDGMLGWFGSALYANYHRVATHSIVGMVCLCALSAGIARYWPVRWFLPFMRPRPSPPGMTTVTPRFRRLWVLAGVGAAWHFVGDMITAWGTLRPFWPFSNMDIQLGWVNSLELPMALLTLAAWAVQNQMIRYGRKRWAWGVACLWLVACGVFIWVRPLIMEPPFT